VLNSVSFHVVPTVPWRRADRFIYYYYTLIGERVVIKRTWSTRWVGSGRSAGMLACRALVSQPWSRIRELRPPGPLAASGNLENTEPRTAPLPTYRPLVYRSQGRKQIGYRRISSILHLFSYFFSNSDLNMDSVNNVG